MRNLQVKQITSALQTIRWQDISALLGDCSAIPEAILDLGSSDPLRRSQAYWKLDNHVVVQGGLFEGAFYVVPFVVEVAISASENCRAESLNLLLELASGAASFHEKIGFQTTCDPFLYYTPDSRFPEVPLCIATRLAVGQGLANLAPILIYASADDRALARELFLLFPEYAYASSEMIYELLLNDVDEAVKRENLQLINELRRGS